MTSSIGIGKGNQENHPVLAADAMLVFIFQKRFFFVFCPS
jgi:hypothetical protein